MNKQSLLLRNSKILTIVIVLFLAVVALFTIVKYTVNGKRVLVSPGMNQPTSQPSISSYNPPQEIKYDASTDLKKELDSIDPVVSESDFKDL